MTTALQRNTTSGPPPAGDRSVPFLLEPLDVLFFRDGRPFGAATRGTSQPAAPPQTLAGAFRTGLLESNGCPFDDLTRRVRVENDSFAQALDALGLPAWIARVAVRGPWLARVSPATAALPEVLVPIPAVLHRRKKGHIGPPFRLNPLPEGTHLPGWNQTQPARQFGLRPLWRTGFDATEPAQGFLTPSGLRAFLNAEPVESEMCLKGEDLFAWDHRTGIRIEPDRLTAEEPLIYAASFLALRHEVSGGRQVLFYAEVVLPEDAPLDALAPLETLRFGGEGRRVALHRLPHPFDWPQAPQAGASGTLLLLTTPAPLKDRWRPAALGDRLIAAAVPGSIPVSGWDLARGGPKPTRFAAAPGSVYFLEGPAGMLPEMLADRPEDRQQGWGCYLAGIWQP